MVKEIHIYHIFTSKGINLKAVEWSAKTHSVENYILDSNVLHRMQQLKKTVYEFMEIDYKYI